MAVLTVRELAAALQALPADVQDRPAMAEYDGWYEPVGRVTARSVTMQNPERSDSDADDYAPDPGEERQTRAVIWYGNNADV